MPCLPLLPHDGLQELVLEEVAKGETVLEGGAGVARADRPDPLAASSSASVTCTPAVTRYFKAILGRKQKLHSLAPGGGPAGSRGCILPG